jgi:DNA-binding beta-propeller fold protein YncE
MSTTSKQSISPNKGNGVVARIIFLDLGAGRILSANPDGSDLQTLVSEGRKLPDGLVVDVAAGHLYWTNMGNPKANDGSIFRSDLDGRNMTTIIAPGGTFTPKQLQIDKPNAKLYWCDREGMRVMRANLDGSKIETLIDTSQLYDKLPEPIDLDLDLASRMLYWTDRGDPPRGNTVNRAPLDAPRGGRPSPEIIFSNLMEGIGLALDPKHSRMFVTDFAGSVYSANLDGSGRKTLLFAEGNLTGIAYVELPAT